MIRTANYKERTLTIPPHDVRLYNGLGNTFGCLDASDTFHVKIGSEGSATQFRKGLTIRTDEAFEQVTIENRSDVPLTVTICISMGDVTDARLVLPAQLSAQSLQPNGWAVRNYEFTTGWINIPENPQRASVRIQGLNSTGPIWLYNDPAHHQDADKADKRLVLGNGGVIELKTGGAMHFIGNYVGGGSVFEFQLIETFFK
jgi:hypothetical protein